MGKPSTPQAITSEGDFPSQPSLEMSGRLDEATVSKCCEDVHSQSTGLEVIRADLDFPSSPTTRITLRTIKSAVYCKVSEQASKTSRQWTHLRMLTSHGIYSGDLNQHAKLKTQSLSGLLKSKPLLECEIRYAKMVKTIAYYAH